MTGYRVVRARSPLRISFAGGGTDVMPYPAEEGGCVLSATIDMFAFAHLRATDDGSITVATDDGMHDDESSEEMSFDGHTELVSAAMSRIVPSTGVELTLSSDAPPGSGLGSSSAMVVAMLAAGAYLERRPFTPYSLARQAYQIERYDLDQAGGMQDQYASAFGGFNFIEFHDEDRVIVHPIKVDSRTVSELHASMLLCHTGVRRKSGGILKRQIEGYSTKTSPTMGALVDIKRLAVEMREALLLGDLERFVAGVDEGWHLKKALATGITNDYLDDLYDIGRAAGAKAGKILGAGGGGYLLLFCEPERRAALSTAMTAAGAAVTRFNFTDHGVTTWGWP